MNTKIINLKADNQIQLKENSNNYSLKSTSAGSTCIYANGSNEFDITIV